MGLLGGTRQAASILRRPSVQAGRISRTLWRGELTHSCGREAPTQARSCERHAGREPLDLGRARLCVGA